MPDICADILIFMQIRKILSYRHPEIAESCFDKFAADYIRCIFPAGQEKSRSAFHDFMDRITVYAMGGYQIPVLPGNSQPGCKHLNR